MKIERINKFFGCNKFAIAGVSRDKKKFGSLIYKELKKKDYNIVAVNPNMDTFEGEKCYRSVKELPPDIEALIVVAKPDISYSIVREAVEKGIRNIFLQQGAQNTDTIKYAEDKGINLIYKQCVMMFAKPAGIHKFHGSICKLFGFYPR